MREGKSGTRKKKGRKGVEKGCDKPSVELVGGRLRESGDDEGRPTK
ncbi:hypothetical protein A2U01_0116880, partial [Trifolium medium]|nr:hypothetical protein [Trifolium medium]